MVARQLLPGSKREQQTDKRAGKKERWYGRTDVSDGEANDSEKNAERERLQQNER